MYERMSRKPGHPWAKFELNLQTVREKRLGLSVSPESFDEAVTVLSKQSIESAVALLRKWRTRNPVLDGEEAAQNWQKDLFVGQLLQTCDDRPKHRFAYGALKFHCWKVVLQSLRLTLQPELEPVSNSISPLEEVIAGEELSLLKDCILRLSANEGLAVCDLLRKPRCKKANKACSAEERKERKKSYDALHRARKQLMKWFSRYRDLDK